MVSCQIQSTSSSHLPNLRLAISSVSAEHLFSPKYLSNTLRLQAQDLRLVLTVVRLYHSAHLLESHQYHFGVIL